LRGLDCWYIEAKRQSVRRRPLSATRRTQAPAALIDLISDGELLVRRTYQRGLAVFCA